MSSQVDDQYSNQISKKEVIQMAFEEKTLTCSDCGATFKFTVEEQELFKTKGYTNEPKRCPSCREARKAQQNSNRDSSYGSFGNRSGGYSSAKREMFPAKCAECGKDTQVPFQPRGDRPVYCSDCYRKIKPAR
jgi:CxxC-x17-CxxC domain-containing protein